MALAWFEKYFPIISTLLRQAKEDFSGKILSHQVRRYSIQKLQLGPARYAF
jgi:hypothetical protein